MFEHFIQYHMQYHASSIESITLLNEKIVKLDEKTIAKVNF